MNIPGPDYLVFAADDVDACAKCLEDYGLIKAERGANGFTYEAQDGRGIQHFTFHFATVDEQLQAGWHFAAKGYKSFWGPGRHVLGSNYFWYFNSPFGGLIEFDADMDRHDDSWTPRRISALADTSQAFLFQYATKWLPHG